MSYPCTVMEHVMGLISCLAPCAGIHSVSILPLFLLPIPPYH